MEKLKILNRKIVVQGESHFVYIPKVYFDNKQLNAEELYEIILIPQKTKKDPHKEKEQEGE